jgi:hypothetical protein
MTQFSLSLQDPFIFSKTFVSSLLDLSGANGKFNNGDYERDWGLRAIS